MSGFKYPATDDPAFSELREASGIRLESDDKLENALEVMGYVHTLFEHDGDNTPSSFDAVTILIEAKAGEQFRCVEYSILAQGLLWAYGIPARVVGLKVANIETIEYGGGHVVLEFWYAKQSKWVMADVQWGIVPKLDGELLSSYEFGQATAQHVNMELVPVHGSRFKPEQTREYMEWIGEYLYFYDSDFQVFHTAPHTDLAGELKLMLVPKGVVPPEMFQGLFKMNLEYTTDPAEFYPDFV